MAFQQDNQDNNNNDLSSEPPSTVVVIEPPVTSSGFGSSQTTAPQGGSSIGDAGSQPTSSSANQPSSSAVNSAVGPSASPSDNVNGGDRNGQDRNGQDRGNDSGSSGLSGDERKAVIATTTVCGTLILLLLLYTIWRRRKGAAYSDIFLFRPQAQIATIDQHEDSHLTALPIYRSNRFSIRSSRHPSRANLLNKPKMAAVPANLRTDNRPGTPLVEPPYSTAPTTPTHKAEWKSFLHDASPPQPSIERPQEAHAANRDSLSALPVMRHPSERSQNNPTANRKPSNKPGPGLTLNLAASNANSNPPQPSLSGSDRWSWTNSQAPSTPRIAAPNNRSSLSSTRIRNVASWVRNQGRASNQDTKLPTTKEKSKPLLKNQAVKPVLAPQPQANSRKGSKSSGKRVGSLSTILKPNSLPVGPLSPRLEEQRGGGEAVGMEIIGRAV